MVIVNALINAVSDLEDRVNLRNEFVALELPAIIKVLRIEFAKFRFRDLKMPLQI